MQKQSFKTWALMGAALSTVSAAVLADNGRWHNWYIAPLATYIVEDSERNVEDAGGFTGVLGYQLSRRFDIEVQGFYYDYERDNGGQDYQSGLSVDGLVVFNRGGRIQPHISVGLGFNYTDTAGNDKTAPFLSAGVGARVPVIKDGLRLRFDAKYIYDFTGNLGREDDFPPQLLGLGGPGGLLGLGLADADEDALLLELREDDRKGDFQDFRLYAGVEVPIGPKVVQAEPKIVEVPAPAPPPKIVEKIVEVPVEKVVEVAERDSDGDGVPDRFDDCPNTPPGLEVDGRGCAKKAQAIPLRGVNFAFDRHDLTPSAQRILDDAVDAMIGQPTMRVELAGHTDSIGTNGYNLRLSQRRADAAKRYMVSRGIAPSRLVTRGYGETEPIAPNTTPDGQDNPEGRALNRRTELRVLEQ